MNEPAGDVESDDHDPSRPVRLGELAHARSGDKGDRFNVGVVAWTDAGYRRLHSQLTADRVAAFFGDLVDGEVRRYPLSNVRAFNFVCERGLDGGGQTSLRYDTQGKTYAAALLTMTLPPLVEAD
ncbi:AtuA-related protein [Haloplanus pelagicus]|jgi:hypothetical protein|uniref:AtuA-related protein n=1 Tax=Haloplanus pelagicus TaxID=2949995 RepID=UPI00203BB8B6|nr:hypothetical protein [Haloplanus sp. HW8-1]